MKRPGRPITEKKSVPEPVFPKSPQALHVLNHGWWRLAVGGWQLAVGGGWWWLVIGGWWRLAVVGSWRLVAAGGWRRLVVGGWWRLVVGGWWRLAADGSWRLAVGGPLGRSLRAVLSNKKKIWSLKDRPGRGCLETSMARVPKGLRIVQWGKKQRPCKALSQHFPQCVHGACNTLCLLAFPGN